MKIKQSLKRKKITKVKKTSLAVDGRACKQPDWTLCAALSFEEIFCMCHLEDISVWYAVLPSHKQNLPEAEHMK